MIYSEYDRYSFVLEYESRYSERPEDVEKRATARAWRTSSKVALFGHIDTHPLSLHPRWTALFGCCLCSPRTISILVVFENEKSRATRKHTVRDSSLFFSPVDIRNTSKPPPRSRMAPHRRSGGRSADKSSNTLQHRWCSTGPIKNRKSGPGWTYYLRGGAFYAIISIMTADALIFL